MTDSPADDHRPTGRAPRPVRLGRYRYSKLRWRLSAHALDSAGALAMRAWRLVRPPRPARDPRRILLVQLDHLGDAVLTSPLLVRLRDAFPRAEIDVLASSSNYEVFDGDPNVDRVHLAAKTWFDRRRGRSALLSAVWSLGRSLRAGRYDWGIDVRGDVLSVLVMALAGIPRRVGWSMGGGGFLLTDVARWLPGRHEVGSRLALFETVAAGGQGVETGPARVAVHVSDRDRVEVARRLSAAWPVGPGRAERSARSFREDLGGNHRLRTATRGARPPAPTAAWDEPDDLHAGRFGPAPPLLAVHLGAGTAAKRWPLARWRSLVARFLADGWRVVVVGAEDDVAAASTLTPHPGLRDWTGRLSVRQTVALLERAELFVGADSGPSHLAAAAGTTSVVLFSGTNRVAQWRPWSRRSLVLRRPVACRPCHLKVCPLADHPCLAGLSAERVHREALRWWSRLNRRESPHAAP